MQNQGLPTSTEGSLSTTAQTTQVRSVPTGNNDVNLIRSPTDLRPGDILLGRGNKHQKWSGNMHFRSLIVEWQEKCVSIKGDNRTKSAIARQIFDAVRAGRASSLAAAAAAVVPALKDGRFLKLVEPEMLAQMGAGDAVDDQQQREREHCWQEAPNDVALEKIKMALRQQKKGGAGSKNGDDDDSSDDDDDSSDDDESSSSSSSSSDIDDEEGSNDSSDVEKRPKSKNKKAKARSKTKKAKNKTKKKKPKRRRKKRDKSPKGGGGSNTSTTDGMPLQVSIGGGGGGGVSAPPLPGSGPA